MCIKYSSGLGWYIYNSITKEIIASQFESKEEAQIEFRKGFGDYDSQESKNEM